MRRIISVLVAILFLFRFSYADDIDNFREKIKERERLEAEELLKEDEEEYLGPSLDDIKEMPYASWSGLTVEQLEKGLKYKLKPLAEAYITAEKTYNVNAVIKAAQDAFESDWGRYCFTKNNISGFFTNADFWSKEECIYYVSSKLEAWYIQPPHEECDHYNCEIGKFFEGRTIYDVSVNYCPNEYGGINEYYGDKVCEIAYDIYKEALS